MSRHRQAENPCIPSDLDVNLIPDLKRSYAHGACPMVLMSAARRSRRDTHAATARQAKGSATQGSRAQRSRIASHGARPKHRRCYRQCLRASTGPLRKRLIKPARSRVTRRQEHPNCWCSGPGLPPTEALRFGTATSHVWRRSGDTRERCSFTCRAGRCWNAA